MDDMDQGDEDLAIEKEMENMPSSDKKIMRGFINKLKSVPSGARRTASQGALAAKAGLIMARMARLSQDAQKLYWDNSHDRQKETPDFDRALRMVNKSISLCDEVILAWPAQMLAIMPMKEKMLAQKRDIELQKAGIVVDPETLMVKKDAPVTGDSGETHA